MWNDHVKASVPPTKDAFVPTLFMAGMILTAVAAAAAYCGFVIGAG